MTISFSEDEKYILEKIQSYCQDQERCIKEVRNKLFSLKATNKTVDKILQSLIDNDYLNEDRYAKMFILVCFLKKTSKLAIFELRKKYKEKFKEKHGVNLGFMSFFTLAKLQTR